MRWAWVVVLAAGCGLSQPAPLLRAVSPAAICGAAAVTLTLDGDGFVALPTDVLRAQAVALPSVTLDGPTQLVLADDPAGASGPVRYVSSHQLELDVQPPPAGLYAVAVGNPDGQSSLLADALTATAVGVVSIESVSPASLCSSGSDETITLRGAGFVAGSTVSVLDAGGTTVLSATATASGCALGRCTTLTFVVPKGTFAIGTYTVQVSSPAGGGCDGSARAKLAIGSGPTLDMVSPQQLCQGSGGTLALTGTGFVAGATVKLVDPSSGMTLDGTLTVTSATQAGASFPPVPFGKNQQVDLVLTNPDGCAGTLSAKIRIKPGNGGC